MPVPSFGVSGATTGLLHEAAHRRRADKVCRGRRNAEILAEIRNTEIQLQKLLVLFAWSYLGTRAANHQRDVGR